MANPQLEDGYTRIANEIMEALSRAMPGFTEGQIIWAVLRKTYGWNKKSDEISISQLCEMTGKSRRMVIYALQNLEKKKMLIIHRKRGRGVKNEINKIAFNKNHEEWVVQEKAVEYRKLLQQRRLRYKNRKNAIVQEKTVVQEPVKDRQILAPTKETITKDNKINKEPPVPNIKDGKTVATYYAQYYKYLFRKNYPINFSKNGKQSKTLWQKLGDEVFPAIRYFLTVEPNDRYFWTTQPKTIDVFTHYIDKVVDHYREFS